MLDNLQANGFNAVFMHVRPMADRLYSKTTYTNPADNATYTVYEPTSAYGTSDGSRGGTLVYDYVEYMVEQCHKRGIEFHAWINPYRYVTYKVKGSTSDKGMDFTTALPGRTTSADVAVWNQGWIIHNTTSSTSDGVTTYETKYTFDPSLEQSKVRICNVIGVLTGAYDIDGIIFDDYFYPDYIPQNSTADDYPRYTDSGSSLSIGDWRRYHVNEMVRRVNQTIKSIKPYVRFGIAPAGAGHNGMIESDNLLPMSSFCSASDWQYDALFSDPMAWLRAQTIDYVSPQLYWRETHKTNAFTPMDKWWSQIPGAFGRHFFPSTTASDTPAAETNAMVVSNRENNQDGNLGHVGYRYGTFLSGGALEYMGSNVYKKQALQPPMTWYSATDPGKVQNLTRTSNNLSWTAQSNMRYVVYALPISTSLEKAASIQGGLLAKFIAEVTYSNSYSIPTDYQTGYYFAVAPYDRYGNEWDYTTYGQPLPDTEVSLSSPASGTTLGPDDSTVLTWSGTDGATFTLQIATDNSFSNLAHTSSGADYFSKSIAAADLPVGTLYWRVKVEKSGYNSAVSATRTLNIAKRPLASPALYKPVDKQHIDADVNFVVQDIGAESYLLEISASDNFDSTFFVGDPSLWTNEFDENGKVWKQYTVPFALFPDGTYYWRVRVSTEGYDDNFSEVRMFTVGSGQVSSYIPYRDPNVFSECTVNSERVILTNLWVRSSTINTLGNTADNNRGLAAHHNDEYLSYDAVILPDRDKLLVYDARSGEKIENIALDFDSSYAQDLYQATSVLSDDNNNLLIHNLALAGNPVSIGHVIPQSVAGNVKTVFKMTPGYRVDHLDVYGDVSRDRNTTYYVFTIGTVATSTSTSITKITRYKVVNDAVAETVEKEFSALNVGLAANIHAISSQYVIVDGRKVTPQLVDFENVKVLSSMSTTFAGETTNPTGIVHFNHGNSQYLAVRNADGFDHWNILQSTNLTTSFTGAKNLWSFPSSALGSASTQNDFVTPVDVLQKDDSGMPYLTLTRANAQPTSTVIYALSPSNGMAAYAMSTRIITGVEDITADPADTDDSDSDAPAQYFNLQGEQISADNLTPGLYLVRKGTKTYKTIIR